ncbi:hypothetical protein KCP71_10505 [Salmonella enterica subsp. enterica]|nr:hypothetical protein KCP71_10505 [Salmonella enterica subsp. enterica]
MEQNIATARARRPPKLGQITSGIPYSRHLLRAFHRCKHRAPFTHHLLKKSDSDRGICEVNLMPVPRAAECET